MKPSRSFFLCSLSRKPQQQLHPRSRQINNSWKILKALWRLLGWRGGWRFSLMGVPSLSPSKRRENLWREIIYYDKVRKNYESRCGGVCSSARARRHKPLNESRSPLDFYALNARGGFFCTLILSKAIFHLFLLSRFDVTLQLPLVERKTRVFGVWMEGKEATMVIWAFQSLISGKWDSVDAAFVRRKVFVRFN